MAPLSPSGTSALKEDNALEQGMSTMPNMMFFVQAEGPSLNMTDMSIWPRVATSLPPKPWECPGVIAFFEGSSFC